MGNNTTRKAVAKAAQRAAPKPFNQMQPAAGGFLTQAAPMPVPPVQHGFQPGFQQNLRPEEVQWFEKASPQPYSRSGTQQTWHRNGETTAQWYNQIMTQRAQSPYYDTQQPATADPPNYWMSLNHGRNGAQPGRDDAFPAEEVDPTYPGRLSWPREGESPTYYAGNTRDCEGTQTLPHGYATKPQVQPVESVEPSAPPMGNTFSVPEQNLDEEKSVADFEVGEVGPQDVGRVQRAQNIMKRMIAEDSKLETKNRNLEDQKIAPNNVGKRLNRSENPPVASSNSVPERSSEKQKRIDIAYAEYEKAIANRFPDSRSSEDSVQEPTDTSEENEPDWDAKKAQLEEKDETVKDEIKKMEDKAITVDNKNGDDSGSMHFYNVIYYAWKTILSRQDKTQFDSEQLQDFKNVAEDVEELRKVIQKAGKLFRDLKDLGQPSVPREKPSYAYRYTLTGDPEAGANKIKGNCLGMNEKGIMKRAEERRKRQEAAGRIAHHEMLYKNFKVTIQNLTGKNKKYNGCGGTIVEQIKTESGEPRTDDKGYYCYKVRMTGSGRNLRVSRQKLKYHPPKRSSDKH